jgi:hypothetical protein
LEEVRERVDADLSTVANLVPRDIALLYGGNKIIIDTGRLEKAEINHDAEQVIVKGVAPGEKGYETIFRYARALRSSGRFSMVVILSIEVYEETIVEEGVEEEDWEVARGYNFAFLLK